MPNRQQIMIMSGINILAGLWLILSPYILGYSGARGATNGIVLGVLIGIVALVRVLSPFSSGWLSWINVLFGLWLLISPFTNGYAVRAMIWNYAIVGIIVGVMAVLSSATAGKEVYAKEKEEDKEKWNKF